MRLNVSRDDFDDDQLARACAGLSGACAALLTMQHRYKKINAPETVEELRLDEDAIGFVLGLLLREQIERRKDDQELAKP